MVLITIIIYFKNINLSFYIKIYFIILKLLLCNYKDIIYNDLLFFIINNFNYKADIDIMQSYIIISAFIL